MTRYRKKPVEIEARLLTRENQHEIAEWCGGFRVPHGRIAIDTLEGTMHANEGDYVIRGVEGEFYPCKPRIFEAMYEEIA